MSQTGTFSFENSLFIQALLEAKGFDWAVEADSADKAAFLLFDSSCPRRRSPR